MEQTQNLIESLTKAVSLYDARLNPSDVIVQRLSEDDICKVINYECANLGKIKFGAIIGEYTDTKLYRQTVEKWGFSALASQWYDIKDNPLPPMPNTVSRALAELKTAINKKMNDLCGLFGTHNKFRSLLQGDEYTKEQVLRQLHSFIDGNKGASVGWPLVKAVNDGLLCCFPTQSEFMDEFELIGSWEAIRKCKDNSESDKAKSYQFVVE